MKKLEAIIDPLHLNEVRDALVALRARRVTATEVRGYGREMGHMEIYRGTSYMDYSTAGIKIEVILQDTQLEDAIEILAKATRNSDMEDGHVFIMPVECAEHAVT